MAEVINLRMARKAKGRADKAVQAAANRAAFGETKAAKQARATDAARDRRKLDGARRDTD